MTSASLIKAFTMAASYDKMENINNTYFRLLFTEFTILRLNTHYRFYSKIDYLNMVTIKEVIEASTETADNHTPTELFELMRL